MRLFADILIGIVALLHAWFLVLEMFLWTRPLGRKVFRMSAEQAAATKTLAVNQGLYNGFLVAGLVWGLVSGDFHVKIFFLACVILAGVLAWSLGNRKVFFVQAFPALIALILLHLH
jgi:putative membrane protein